MDFYKRARIVCLAIPYGKAATYGQIALLCGKPKNARQMGYALNRNARGILSGAAAFETEDMQRSLMEAEGIQVEWTADGWQVDLKRYGWKNTMEEALGFLEILEAQGI